MPEQFPIHSSRSQTLPSTPTSTSNKLRIHITLPTRLYVENQPKPFTLTNGNLSDTNLQKYRLNFDVIKVLRFNKHFSLTFTFLKSSFHLFSLIA